MDDLFKENCIRTFSGAYVDIMNPTPEMIRIEDIAHGLGMLCRFGGQLPKFYSVAEHSIHTSNLLPQELKLEGLMHDASEAYLMNIPSPIKKLLGLKYAEMEYKFMEVIAAKFGFKFPFHDETHEMDRIMLRQEWTFLMLQEGIYPKFKNYRPEFAEAQFMWYFNQLSK